MSELAQLPIPAIAIRILSFFNTSFPIRVTSEYRAMRSPGVWCDLVVAGRPGEPDAFANHRIQSSHCFDIDRAEGAVECMQPRVPAPYAMQPGRSRKGAAGFYPGSGRVQALCRNTMACDGSAE